MPQLWVVVHDIADVLPLDDPALHRLPAQRRRERGDHRVMTRAHSDYDGCCTENLCEAKAPIDLEKYMNERFGSADGPIE